MTAARRIDELLACARVLEQPPRATVQDEQIAFGTGAERPEALPGRAAGQQSGGGGSVGHDLDDRPCLVDDRQRPAPGRGLARYWMATGDVQVTIADRGALAQQQCLGRRLLVEAIDAEASNGSLDNDRACRWRRGRRRGRPRFPPSVRSGRIASAARHTRGRSRPGCGK